MVKTTEGTITLSNELAFRMLKSMATPVPDSTVIIPKSAKTPLCSGVCELSAEFVSTTYTGNISCQEAATPTQFNGTLVRASMA